ncbi:Zinc finger RING/FYVE/PHD-type protein [Dioscorea alata]|uniref:Zinc finger RING/FYVE/PHD-type protein n=1 Tax=Dioscorea alata TaxID=55571 RepID=A0ACB7V1Y1_DIOAL|nr:Zinc finger RING/FYVE/PHD-type protein [Dioscorea alata]
MIDARTHFTLPPISGNQNHMHLYQSGTMGNDGKMCDLKLSVVKYEGGHDDQVDKEEQVVCVFCLCEVNEGDKIREIKCHHVFHLACLDKWLDSWGDTCPLCRVSLSTTMMKKKKIEDDDIERDENESRSSVFLMSRVPSSWWI